jgi:hypothetical protein
MLRACFIACVLFSTLPPARGARAQAWPQPKHGAYVKLSHGRTTAAEHYSFEGERQPYAETFTGDAFFDRSYYLYGEWGLTGNLTLVGLVPFKTLTVREEAFDLTTGGLGSVAMGLRVGLKPLFRLAAPRHALAANLMLTLPTGYTRNLAPAIGTGQADAQAVLSYGASLYPFPAYVQAGLGLRVRSGFYGLSRSTPCPPEAVPRTCADDARPNYDDEWLLAAEAGASLGRWALLQWIGQGVWSNQPPESNFSPANPLPTHTRYLKSGLGLTLYPLPRLGLSLQYFNTLFGRNTIRSADWFFGLEFKTP